MSSAKAHRRDTARRRGTVDRPEADLSARSQQLTPAQWETLTTLLETPPRDLPELDKLLSAPRVFQSVVDESA